MPAALQVVHEVELADVIETFYQLRTVGASTTGGRGGAAAAAADDAVVQLTLAYAKARLMNTDEHE